MSVLDRFEKSVEGAVNGVFAKFGSKDLKPVDLSSALEREIDKEAMPVTRDRTVARRVPFQAQHSGFQQHRRVGRRNARQ